ncbi:MAG TPA: hypothetical protein VFE53_11280 [Mucilaginibacter sp.]|jgi:hypothetical protein|nr:hypothetical protein [Mucilaginibacter sp.]
MKNVFTIIFLLACLKLSAAAPSADSLKHAKHAPKAHLSRLAHNTVKTNTTKDTSKVAGKASKQDSLKLLSAVTPATDSGGSALAQGKDSSAMAVSVVQPDKSKQNWFYNMPSVTFVTDVKPVEAAAPEPEDLNPPVTSLLQLDSLKNELVIERIQQENLRKLILRNEQIKLARVLKINDMDSLKMELKTATVDTIKALLYSRIAQKYMDYDTLSDATKQQHYQNAALNYTLLAIHEYSQYSDSVGLRDSYTNLSKVYCSQKKYTEAKWFILQANTLSRARGDTPNVISSLLALATIKSDIKDYKLAMGDLNEAMQLSVNNHKLKTELEVLKNYALLYSNLQDYPKEEMVLKKRDSLLDSLRKADEAQLAKAAALKKKQDALNKKKQYIASLKKPSKGSSQPKVASL